MKYQRNPRHRSFLQSYFVLSGYRFGGCSLLLGKNLCSWPEAAGNVRRPQGLQGSLKKRAWGRFLCLLGQGQCNGRVPPSETHPWLLGTALPRVPKVDLGSQSRPAGMFWTRFHSRDTHFPGPSKNGLMAPIVFQSFPRISTSPGLSLFL